MTPTPTEDTAGTGPPPHVPLVLAHGTPHARGHRHGTALGARLRAFVGDGLARLSHILPGPLSLESLRPALAAHRAEIETQTPRLMAEIRGLAAGAGLSEEEALLLQLRREIMGYRRIPAAGDCTTYARAGGDTPPVLAQTVDLNGDLDDHISVLRVAPTGSPRHSLVLSFGGLLGYLGINSDGLAVGLNLVLGGTWRPGLPPYLAIRHLLDTTSGVDEAVRELRRLRLTSSRTLVLCDTRKTAWVEILGDDLRVAEAAVTTHTNHFLHPDFAPHDALNVFARNFSRLRLETCRRELAALPPEAGVEDHFAVLSRAPLRVEGNGDIRRERTVAAVVLRPGLGELHVRPGDPAHSRTRSFRLHPAEVTPA
ncbi:MULTISPECIES: C45 family autoproteolytic acyltransferase/hydolase [Streptomyces]|uniref:C45 family autoproteolytic acyltransferase/hydolase n=1 Tax=Streptomyces TaxID=1883 RepID=UPI001902CEE6|nr:MULTISPECIES: C45 family peptidase [unclassified Streptomyces]MCU4749727.1 C45 family peptidase [Streptomyces sp. G-5]QQN76040.1 peptidase C45 [Streptomyces sp. XC 2026]